MKKKLQKNKSLALEILFSICNVWTIMDIKQNFLHGQDEEKDGLTVFVNVYNNLQKK